MTSGSRQSQVRPEGAAGLEAQEKGGWPNCAPLGGTCVVYEVGQHVGAEVSSALFGFIANAEEGARLILQKNPKGFTVQVTNAVQRGTAQSVGLPELRALRNQLNIARNEREKQSPIGAEARHGPHKLG
ncbi:MAG: hypothetical protein Q7K03_05195 [Dehalococcoidia bacterium]|nr:hypothetical protein [Dehalococcoidia bacterium]